MTSHQQPTENTPRSCPSSSTPPAHTDQPTQCSLGQQGASPVMHSPKPRPKVPGSISYRCAFLALRTKANCRLDGLGTSAARAKAPPSPPAPKGKGTEVANIIYRSTCAERPCILPGGGAGAEEARGKSGKRSTGVMEIAWRAFQLQGYCSECGPVDGPYQALSLHSTYFMAMS